MKRARMKIQRMRPQKMWAILDCERNVMEVFRYRKQAMERFGNGFKPSAIASYNLVRVEIREVRP